MQPQAILSVFEFDFCRTLTWRRSLLVLAIAIFPVALIGLVQYQGAHLEHGDRAGFALFFLLPFMTCLVGLLLWACPTIHMEIEERTWTYLAVRPVGRGAIVLGKYLAAVAWTSVCVGLGLVLCLALLYPKVDVLALGLRFGALCVLASLTYGALFVLFGVLFPHRAMVAAVAYTAGIELTAGFVPATINRLSVQYHLRCLLQKWGLIDPMLHSPDPRFRDMFFSGWPAWYHILFLTGLSAAALTVAVLVLRRRQLVTAIED